MAGLSTYTIVFIALVLLELLYFTLADRFNIIDKPNHRSSHTQTTIRGGGIIFAISALGFFIYSGYSWTYFFAGLSLIAAISFTDDLITLKSSIRSLIHFIAVSLLLFELDLDFSWLYVFMLIAIIGTINAYNFMDGINGITGGYSFVTLSTLFFVNRYIVSFTSEAFLIFILLSIMVFNFFNFRKKAKCFAGDVGSISIAFILCFVMTQLLMQTQNFLFIGLLLVYGLDTVTTIMFRLIRRENISEAHRTHFYQYLANERQWPHLKISFLYCLLQLTINAIIIYHYENYLETNGISSGVISLCGATGIFIMIRFIVEGKIRLLLSRYR